MNTEDYKEYSRWNTTDNGKIIPLCVDLNLPTKFVMKHFKGAIIVGNELLLPKKYYMETVIECYKNYVKEPSQRSEISEYITYKHMMIPVSFILENFPGAASYYEDGKKILELPNSCGIKYDFVAKLEDLITDHLGRIS